MAPVTSRASPCHDSSPNGMPSGDFGFAGSRVGRIWIELRRRVRRQARGTHQPPEPIRLGCTSPPEVRPMHRAASLAMLVALAAASRLAAQAGKRPVADGYRGIWYYNQPSNDEYKYKYSGGFATYPQQH